MRSRWSKLRANEKFLSVEENATALERCIQLLSGRDDALD
ncbi:hypothetical protein SynBIOSE41_03131 [Synechococcus sp. BIOS-E4-1]|nr:hypothetical protein SynBIOSE41_03131 [Synechococcus sp. BIOS-E4-1]